MVSEKSKEDYYSIAAQYLNHGERAGAESGEGVSGTLAFLTRGAYGAYMMQVTYLPMIQAFSNSQLGRWMMLCGHSKVYWQ